MNCYFLTIFQHSFNFIIYLLYDVTISQTLSPSATSHIFSPVAGLIVGNVLPLTESTNLLLMKTYTWIHVQNSK